MRARGPRSESCVLTTRRAGSGLEQLVDGLERLLVQLRYGGLHVVHSERKFQSHPTVPPGRLIDDPTEGKRSKGPVQARRPKTDKTDSAGATQVPTSPLSTHFLSTLLPPPPPPSTASPAQARARQRRMTAHQGWCLPHFPFRRRGRIDRAGSCNQFIRGI